MNIQCDLAKAKAVLVDALGTASVNVVEAEKIGSATEHNRNRSGMELALWHASSYIKALLLLNEAEANEDLNRPTIPAKVGKSK